MYMYIEREREGNPPTPLTPLFKKHVFSSIKKEKRLKTREMLKMLEVLQKVSPKSA